MLDVLSTIFLLVFLPIIMLAAAVLIGQALSRRQPPEDTQLDPDVAPLAQKTWAAHTSVQRLDAAVLMEGPTEIVDALDDVITKAGDLNMHLMELRGSRHAEER